MDPNNQITDQSPQILAHVEETQQIKRPFLHWSRGLIIVVIAALCGTIIILGGLFLALKQTPSSEPRTTTKPKVVDQNLNWKTYTNAKYNYSFQYPSNYVVNDDNGLAKPYDTSVYLELNQPGAGIPPFFVSVMPNPPNEIQDENIYDSISRSDMDKIFALQVGQLTDHTVTTDLNGAWNQKDNYVRLPDQIVDNEKFLVIELKQGYGGTDRKLFLRKNNLIYVTGSTYQKTEDLNFFNSILATFKFTN